MFFVECILWQLLIAAVASFMACVQVIESHYGACRIMRGIDLQMHRHWPCVMRPVLFTFEKSYEILSPAVFFFLHSL